MASIGVAPLSKTKEPKDVSDADKKQAIQDQVRLLDHMVQSGTMTRKVANILREGASSVSIKDIKKSTEDLERQHKIKEKVSQKREIVKGLLEKTISSAEISLISEESIKRRKALEALEKSDLYLSDKLVEKNISKRILAELDQIEAEIHQEEKLELKRHAQARTLFRPAQRAYKNLGYRASITVFGKTLKGLQSLRHGKGASAEYAELCAQVTEKDLKIAQQEGAKEYMKDMDAWSHPKNGFAWDESVRKHTQLLSELSQIQKGGLLTPDLQQVQRRAGENIKKCTLELKAEPFEVHLLKSREFAEKNLKWQESLVTHQGLLSMAKQYPSPTKGITKEQELIEANITKCQKNINSDSGGGSEQKNKQEMIEDLILQEAGEYVVPFLLASLTWQNEFDAGKETRRDMTVQEIKRHYDDTPEQIGPLGYEEIEKSEQEAITETKTGKQEIQLHISEPEAIETPLSSSKGDPESAEVISLDNRASYIRSQEIKREARDAKKNVADQKVTKIEESGRVLSFPRALERTILKTRAALENSTSAKNGEESEIQKGIRQFYQRKKYTGRTQALNTLDKIAA